MDVLVGGWTSGPARGWAALTLIASRAGAGSWVRREGERAGPEQQHGLPGSRGRGGGRGTRMGLQICGSARGGRRQRSPVTCPRCSRWRPGPGPCSAAPAPWVSRRPRRPHAPAALSRPEGPVAVGRPLSSARPRAPPGPEPPLASVAPGATQARPAAPSSAADSPELWSVAPRPRVQDPERLLRPRVWPLRRGHARLRSSRAGMGAPGGDRGG